MHTGEAKLKAERSLFRQSIGHHLSRERTLERLLADFIALAQHKPRCRCHTATALRHLAAELDTPEPKRH